MSDPNKNLIQSVQDYELSNFYERQDQRALQRAKKRKLEDEFRQRLLEKTIDHRLEKDRITHETDEKIRLTRALLQQKREEKKQGK